MKKRIEAEDERRLQKDKKLNLDRDTGLQDAAMRTSLSFADSDKDELNKLRKGGYDAERLNDGTLVYMNKATNQPTAVDEERMSLYDLADHVGDLPEVVGGLVGSIAGGVSGSIIPVIGTVGTGMVLAGLGAAEGRYYKKLINNLIGGDSELLGWNTAKDLLITFGFEAMGEGVGMFLAKLLRPLAGKISPQTMKGIDNFIEHGGRMTPAQATDNWLARFMENVAEKGAGSGGIIEGFKEGQRESIDNWTKHLASEYGPSLRPDWFGNMVQSSLNKKGSLFRAAAGPIFKRVDVLTEKVIVSKGHIENTAQNLLKELKIYGPGNKELKLEKLFAASGQKQTQGMLEEMLSLPETLTFSDAQKLRSAWHAVAQSPVTLVPDNVSRHAKLMVKAVDTAMVDMSKGLSKEAKEAFRFANEFWKSGKDKFNDTFITSVLKQDPERVGKFALVDGGITNIRKLKNIVGQGSHDWKKLQAGYVQNLFEKNEKGLLVADDIRSKMKSMGEPALREIFNGGRKVKDINKLVDTLEIIQKEGSGTGKMLIQLAQGGALSALVFAPLGSTARAGAGLIVLGPIGIAKLVTHPKGIKWLTEGLTTPHGKADKAIKLSTRLIALMAKENIEPGQ